MSELLLFDSVIPRAEMQHWLQRNVPLQVEMANSSFDAVFTDHQELTQEIINQMYEVIEHLLVLFPTCGHLVPNFYNAFHTRLYHPEFPAYLNGIKEFLKEAAALGFESVDQVFGSTGEALAKTVTGQSIFTLANLLALRIYMADVQTQLVSGRCDLLRNLGPAFIFQIFGNMPAVSFGQVKNPTVISADDHFQRENSLIVYQPDNVLVNRCNVLVQIGEMLGRHRKADRLQSLKIIQAAFVEHAGISSFMKTFQQTQLHPAFYFAMGMSVGQVSSLIKFDQQSNNNF